MTQHELLSRLETETKELLEAVRSGLAPLAEADMRRRPHEQAWNILECMAHLNAYFTDYLPKAELAIHKAKARQWASGQTVKYSGRARRALARLRPDKVKPRRAKKRYNFIHKPLGVEVVKTFIINLELLARTLDAAREVDLNRAKVPKAHSWFGRYSLGNILEILVVHAQRHVQQARRLAPAATTV